MTITPEQFNKIATKDDLKDLKREITEELGEKIDDVLTVVDGLAKKVDNFQTELAANRGAHDRFEEKFVHTGKRLSVLERKTV